MKVLKKGHDRNLGKRVTCTNCAALLLVLPCDVTSHSDDGDYWYTVLCPDCRKTFHVGKECKELSWKAMED